MKYLLIMLAAMLLAGCVQETGPNGRKPDPVASARDRVAIAAEYLKDGDNEHAQLQLKRALELNPDSAEAHNMMGVLLERDGDIKGADREYRKAVKLRDNFSQAHNNYGVFLFRNARYKEAMKQFAAASDDLGYEMRAQAYEGMARSALKIGEKSTASYGFERALKLDASLPLSNLGMAEVQFQQQDYAASRSYYQRFLQLTPNTPQTAQSLWLGIRLERHNGNRDALASYELALKKLYPDSPEYRLYAESLKSGQ